MVRDDGLEEGLRRRLHAIVLPRPFVGPDAVGTAAHKRSARFAYLAPHHGRFPLILAALELLVAEAVNILAGHAFPLPGNLPAPSGGPEARGLPCSPRPWGTPGGTPGVPPGIPPGIPPGAPPGDSPGATAPSGGTPELPPGLPRVDPPPPCRNGSPRTLSPGDGGAGRLPRGWGAERLPSLRVALRPTILAVLRAPLFKRCDPQDRRPGLLNRATVTLGCHEIRSNGCQCLACSTAEGLLQVPILKKLEVVVTLISDNVVAIFTMAIPEELDGPTRAPQAQLSCFHRVDQFLDAKALGAPATTDPPVVLGTA